MFVDPQQAIVVLLAFFSALILLYVHRRNAARTASVKFRNVLLTKLTGLYPVASNWPGNIHQHLESVFPDISAAVAEFRPYVPPWRRKAFDRDWFAYYCDTGREVDRNCQVYHHYMDFTSPEQPVPNGKQTFHRNVSRLLSYAGEP